MDINIFYLAIAPVVFPLACLDPIIRSEPENIRIYHVCLVRKEKHFPRITVFRSKKFANLGILAASLSNKLSLV